jgi:hypothetical protein
MNYTSIFYCLQPQPGERPFSPIPPPLRARPLLPSGYKDRALRRVRRQSKQTAAFKQDADQQRHYSAELRERRKQAGEEWRGLRERRSSAVV